MFPRFGKDYKAKFTSAFGVDGRSIRGMGAEDFKKKSRQLISRAKEELQKYKGRCEISLFSHWFSEFTTDYSANASSLGHKLLVPSMAVAGSEFSSVHNVEIVGFGKNVNIFSSKQKPKKLIVYAANFATHEFIVKVRRVLRAVMKFSSTVRTGMFFSILLPRAAKSFESIRGSSSCSML